MKTYKTERGQEYFCVYRVIATGIESGKKYHLNTYLDEQKAKDYRDFARQTYNEMYKYFWIEEEIVWTKVY